VDLSLDFPSESILLQPLRQRSEKG